MDDRSVEEPMAPSLSTEGLRFGDLNSIPGGWAQARVIVPTMQFRTTTSACVEAFAARISDMRKTKTSMFAICDKIPLGSFQTMGV